MSYTGAESWMVCSKPIACLPSVTTASLVVVPGLSLETLSMARA